MSKQPEWQFVANLGDTNPVENGGYFIFRDVTGVYSAEAEYWNPDTHEAHRVVLDRMYLYNGTLIPFSIWQKHSNGIQLPYELSSYGEWFNDELDSVSAYVGMELTELSRLFCSDNPVELAEAYRAIYDYHGWINGDSDPLKLTEAEAEKRYSKYI